MSKTLLARYAERIQNKPGFLRSIGKVYLLCLVLGCSSFAAQVNCIKVKDASGATVGTFCKSFNIKAGSNISFSQDSTQSTLTIDASAGFGVASVIDAVQSCSVPTNGHTDAAPTIQACLDAYPGRHIVLPKVTAPGQVDYTVNSTLKLKGLGQWLECASGGTYGDNTIPSTFLGGSGVILQYASNVSGIELDNALTQAPKVSGCYLKGGDKWGITTLAGSVAGTADGIIVGSNHARIEDMFVQGFSRNGLNCDTSLKGSYNGNNLFVLHSTFYYNRNNGIRMKGNDCNNGSFYNTDTSYNQYWGIFESSFLGNDYYSPHTSSNHYAAATQSEGATKNISTISSVSNVVTIVFSSAHGMITGNGVVISSVTYGGSTAFDGTFQPITVVNSTTITYAQTREDSSGTGGTGRAPTYQEQWTVQGLDGGGIKQPTTQAVNRSAYFSPYTEGGQGDNAGPGNKWSQYGIIFGGKNPDADMTLSPNIIYSATAQTRMTGGLYVWNENDVNNTAFYRAGTAAGSVRHFLQSYLDNAGTGQWGVDVDPNGTSGSWILCRSTPGCASPRRLSFYGSANANGITRMNSESTGAVEFNNDANMGTGGIKVCDGAATPACLQIKNSTASTVGSAGAASALPATPSGYLVVVISGTTFKIPYFAN